MRPVFVALLLVLSCAQPSRADAPRIVAAVARPGAQGLWQFEVTLVHPDSGWDHYASAWEVLTPDGARLGLRELAHPHVDEQPFTRALSRTAIPEGVTEVVIRARCNLDGWAPAGFTLTLP